MLNACHLTWPEVETALKEGAYARRTSWEKGWYVMCFKSPWVKRRGTWFSVLQPDDFAAADWIVKPRVIDPSERVHITTILMEIAHERLKSKA